jgi:hypothetical protein
MNAPVIAVVLSLLALAPAQAQPVKGGAIVAEQVEAVLTVLVVDPAKRQVVVRGPRGNVTTLDVPPEAQNLDQVKQGSKFKVKYVEAIALGIRKGGTASASAGESVRLAPKGANPGGVAVRAVQLAGVIEAIDLKDRYVAIRGPKGAILALKAADDVNLQELSAGDRIAVTYTEAVAMEMIPQAPAKKQTPAKTAK